MNYSLNYSHVKLVRVNAYIIYTKVIYKIFLYITKLLLYNNYRIRKRIKLFQNSLFISKIQKGSVTFN